MLEECFQALAIDFKRLYSIRIFNLHCPVRVNYLNNERASQLRAEFSWEYVQPGAVQQYLLVWFKSFLSNSLVMEQFEPLFVNPGAFIRLTPQFIQLIQLQQALLTCLSQIKIKSFNSPISPMFHFDRKMTCLSINKPIGRHTKDIFKSSTVDPKSIGKSKRPIFAIWGNRFFQNVFDLPIS